MRASAVSVSFDAGARSAWHTHPRGQILIVTVTAGAGRVQQWGGAIEEIRQHLRESVSGVRTLPRISNSDGTLFRRRTWPPTIAFT